MSAQTAPIISVKEAINRMNTDSRTIFIDVRNNKDYTMEHIPKSINIPLKNFQTGQYILSKAYKYIVYCDHGGASMQVAIQLAKENFSVETLAGGFAEYKRYMRSTHNKR